MRHTHVRHTTVLLGLLAVGAFACSQKGGEVARAPQDRTGLIERSFLGTRLKLWVPADFAVMDDEMLRLKYPSERRPTIVLTNSMGSVNVAINHTQDSMSESKMTSAHAAIEKTFRSLYPSANWFRSEITTINGRTFFVMDVRTPAVDTEVRNILAGTHLDHRLLLLTFNCTKDLEASWEPIGQRVIASAAVSD